MPPYVIYWSEKLVCTYMLIIARIIGIEIVEIAMVILCIAKSER